MPEIPNCRCQYLHIETGTVSLKSRFENLKSTELVVSSVTYNLCALRRLCDVIQVMTEAKPLKCGSYSTNQVLEH
jgi:hypothetical protein